MIFLLCTSRPHKKVWVTSPKVYTFLYRPPTKCTQGNLIFSITRQIIYFYVFRVKDNDKVASVVI